VSSSLRLSSLAALALLALSACGPTRFEPEVRALPAEPGEYDPIDRYDYMPIPSDNALTAEKAALGRQLYYDPRLSGDGVRSCYGCHVCEHGLTDGQPTALGAFDKQLSRSSPTMWNIGYHENLYWDGRAPSLEKQALAAWKGGNMGAKDTTTVLATLAGLPGYARQFEAVFGEAPSEDNVTKALASYMRTIISDDTPWDRWQKGDEDAVSDQAKRGYAVFQELGCVECHAGVLFTDQQFHNVGVGMDAESPDVGRFKVTGEVVDTGAFKTPTLRDITRSAPYFHNGSVATLEEAVRQMATGGLPNPHLSDKLKANAPSDEQVGDLMAFLASLEQPCDDSQPELPQPEGD
jgi:cytochrome c peroxidase